ncbi:pentatricopeptide repeat-containing protein At2g22410, mitochondrial [Andrographis paniculata]|uniref:pentatricopeptide repeat-containing protein At2g22410, mitochondrial n=1 Tax=Andrographis paniculata TaxID=175694 RepID=UPI0021E727D9|nr:pentatricopeptide repeat-containing protein At2g22410, mitochondrial [Andrographis paniculata]
MLSLLSQRRRIRKPFSNPFRSRHTLSALPQRRKRPKRICDGAATEWNTTHIFVTSNPTLSILETKCKSLFHLKQIQSQMTVTGLASDGLAYSRLVAFCALSPAADLNYAKRLLFAMENPNAFSWNVVIRAVADSPAPSHVFVMYKQMLAAGAGAGGGFGLRPDRYTYPLLFKACANLEVFDLGFAILGNVLKMCYDSDVFVRNALIHFLVCCGELEAAHKVFDESPVRDLVSWNSLINGYVRSGRGEEALRIYRRMELDPDEVTMIAAVAACAQLENLELGRELHQFAGAKGMNITVRLGNALVDMYAKCGDLDSARALFDGMEEKTVVSWTTMVVGYAKFGYLDFARKVFDAMPEKDIVPWNALLSGYIKAQRGKQALRLFHEMQATGVEPDEVTMVCCLSACAQLGALDAGVWIHGYIEKHALSLNVVLGTALVDMYAKCGNIKKALQVFRDIPGKNTHAYTAIIGGLALHGVAQDALSLFSDMIDAGLAPDAITFLGVLSACCHGGLVERGQEIFSEMVSGFGIRPQAKHYSCMVDLLGRAGLLKEAMATIESMPMEADAVIWGAMFFACRMHKNIEIGETAAAKLMELDPGDSAIYVVLASMYREANMGEKADEVRKTMKMRGVEKTPGCSAIEVDGKVFEFVVKDESHRRRREIYQCLLSLSGQMGSVSLGLVWKDLDFVF